ncbi:hypothetical protein ACQP1O_02885 [Nocardia sp. CA-151230]|uniref:hypothetical protein n=1 Tax=Nocardia sp. CA-151230 TaxID=3239982 RepID=UPI003D8CD5D2
MGYQHVIAQAMSATQPHLGEGAVSDHVPGLAQLDPQQFEFAVATVDRQLFTGGDMDGDRDCRSAADPHRRPQSRHLLSDVEFGNLRTLETIGHLKKGETVKPDTAK